MKRWFISSLDKKSFGEFIFSEFYFVILQKFCIFAACSSWNERPKIQKSREVDKF
nr:MAG TPA: hypothetical protein [Caudoviricetes sp.]